MSKVDDQLVDMSYVINKNCNLEIYTSKNDDNNIALDVIRHSTSHLMAQAVARLFPKAQVVIGPVIKDGFYYDFYYKEGFSDTDLEKIEKEMHNIVKENLSVSKTIVSKQQAIKYFSSIGENYKVKVIQNIPDDKLSIYKQGEFSDLCRGPHISNTSQLKAFKLTKVSGSYWQGNSNNESLQRIYGTAWHSKKDLDNYLLLIEQAKLRDHRKIAKQQELFHMQQEAPGMIFWHHNGWTLYKIIEQYIRDIFNENNYNEIKTPQLIDRTLWEKSGHWDKFYQEMFTTESENRLFAIKPMNCPAHIQVYKQGIHSYKDLPLRLAEFGSCHRNELSGTLHGLMRVRNFTQDDGHIFCTHEQIESEASNFIKLSLSVYKKFGFNNISIKLSTRPETRVGSDKIWDKAEDALKKVLQKHNINFEIQKGEGAFYGPKIDFILTDSLERIWQCGTLQLDFSMPKKLDAFYIDKDNSKKIPLCYIVLF